MCLLRKERHGDPGVALDGHAVSLLSVGDGRRPLKTAAGVAVEGPSSRMTHTTTATMLHIVPPLARRATGLAGFDFAKIRARLLFVHHVDDGCAACPYVDAARLATVAIRAKFARMPQAG